MNKSCDIFDLYRETVALSDEDTADFLVYVQDTASPVDGAMAVSGLTLSLLEGQWSTERVLLLMKAYTTACCDMIRERAVVGLLMSMMRYSAVLREKYDLLDKLQEILTDDPELCFTALCNIARTAQVKQLEKFNQELTKEIMPLMSKVGSDEFYDVIRKHQSDMERIARMHLDQNFLIFRGTYQTPFFRERAAHWLLPWDDNQLQNVREDEREQLQGLLDLWPMCDSDKYALIGMSSIIRNTLKEQLQGDLLAQMDSLGHADIVTNGYVQQLYRYFRLSSFTQSTPFDLVNYLRDTIVYRLVVVGERAKHVINEILN